MSTQTVPPTKLMERVRALLTQAEHPNTSQAEAEAFTQKAADLMAKYGIDAALVAERAETRETVTSVRIDLSGTYTAEKATLAGWIADAYRCRTLQHHDRWKRGAFSHVTVFGFPSDLQRVEILYTSLLLQATRDLARQTVPYWENTAAYRRSWLVGFASAVGHRLQAAEKHAADDAEGTRTEGRSVALVLADRSTQVNAAVDDAFPKLGKGRRRTLSGGGDVDGYRAGQRADIGGTKVAGAGRARIGGAL